MLQGAFKDEFDRFAKGDIEVANEELVHQPVAKPGMDCICLAATDAPLRFSGLIPRIAPVSPQLALCFIAEKVLGLPKSY